MRVRIIVKRIVIYFLLIMFAFLLQTCFFPMLKFLAAAPNLLLIITFSYGFMYGTTTGIICGLFAGLMMDTFYPGPFGLFILILVCDFFYNAAMILYRVLTLGFVNMEFLLKKVVLPEMFFTLLVTIAVYHVLLNTNKKLDAIDDLRGQNAA